MRSRRREYERRQRARTGAKKKPAVLAAIVFVLVAVVVALIFVIPKIREALSSRELPAGDGSANEERVEVLGESDDETGKKYHFDAEQYYREHGTLLNIYDASSYEGLLSEVEIISEFKERGFAEQAITTDYYITGELISEYSADTGLSIGKIVGASDEQYPVYELHYTSSSGDFWSIGVAGDSFVANPVSFTAEAGLSYNVVVSESKEILYYDGFTNSYYEVIPNESELKVVVVEHIDAETLDQLTVEEILRRVGER